MAKFVTYKNEKKIESGNLSIIENSILPEKAAIAICAIARQFNIIKDAYNMKDMEKFTFMDKIKGSFDRAVVRLSLGVPVKFGKDSYRVDINQ